MEENKQLFNLVQKIKEVLSDSIIFKLKRNNNQQLLVALIPHHGKSLILDTLIDFDNQEIIGSFIFPVKQLPEQCKNLFFEYKKVIVTPIPHFDDTFLLSGLSEKEKWDINSESLLIKLIDLLVDNDRLKQSSDLKEKKYQSYIREVKTIKEKLLPGEGHVIEGLDYATYYRPSVGGGGDYFDIMDLRDARRRAGYENPSLIWGVGLMDVSGHGPGAAVEVAMVDAILRTYQGKKDSGPGDVLRYLNKYYFTRQFRGGFSTGFLCNYDASTDLFSYSSAGHLPILIKHKGGKLSILKSETGIPIGVEQEYEWVTETMQLDKGDTIILYTDGITEAESISGEQFGFERLTSCIEKSKANSAEDIMSDFMDTFHQHASNSVEQDDQTLIMITISS